MLPWKFDEHEVYRTIEFQESQWKTTLEMEGPVLSQGESFLGRKWLIGKKIKKELDKPEGISHAKMV